MDYERFGPISVRQIEEWPEEGGSYRTLVLSSDAIALKAAWAALQKSYPDSELLMRKGAQILERRGPLHGR